MFEEQGKDPFPMLLHWFLPLSSHSPRKALTGFAPSLLTGIVWLLARVLPEATSARCGSAVLWADSGPGFGVTHGWRCLWGS